MAMPLFLFRIWHIAANESSFIFNNFFKLRYLIEFFAFYHMFRKVVVSSEETRAGVAFYQENMLY